MSDWKFSIKEFGKVDDEVRRLLDDAVTSSADSHVFFHPALMEAWIETYRPLRHIDFFIVTGNSHNNHVVFPMALWRRNWKHAFLKNIIAIGYSDYDYHDPLFQRIPDNAEIKQFLEELKVFLQNQFSFDIICLDGVTDNVLPSSEGWVQNEMCPYLDLKDIDNEEALMSFFSTSLRGDIRRQIRRINEHGELRIVEYRDFESIPKDTCAEFMRQHTLRWPNAYKAPHFHENLLKYGLKEGVVHFSVLKCGDVEIAWNLGFSFNGTYYYYMPAGNQDYLKFSPVKIHLYHLVLRAIKLGYATFDHLRGDETYKSGWSNGYKHVNSLTVTSKDSKTTLKRKIMNIRRYITALPQK